MAARLAIPDTAFRTSHGKKRPRIEDGKYLAWIRGLPCVVTGRRDGIEAAHVRYGDPIFGKRETGKGERPDDRWALPLHCDQHRDQHAHGDERGWWKNIIRMDPLQVCLALYHISGDDQAALGILDEARKRRLPRS